MENRFELCPGNSRFSTFALRLPFKPKREIHFVKRFVEHETADKPVHTSRPICHINNALMHYNNAIMHHLLFSPISTHKNVGLMASN